MVMLLAVIPIRYRLRSRERIGVLIFSSYAIFLLSVGVVSRVDAATVIGPVYEIKEPSALDQIQDKLAAMDKSGELAQKQREFVERSIQSVEEPPPINLPLAKEAKTFFYDPSFILDKDLPDGQGNVLHKAGTRVNPLDWVSFSKHWLFIDGKNHLHIQFALDLMRRYDGKLKIILVKGRPLDLGRKYAIPFYFDQSGLLSTRFGIKAIPAIVSQEHKKLKIDEVVL